MTITSFEPTAHRADNGPDLWSRSGQFPRGRRVRRGPGAFIDLRKPSRHTVPSTVWPDESAAFNYAKRQLRELRREHRQQGLRLPDERAVQKMIDLLRSVLANDSVYPTMSVDEDGAVIAEWHVLGDALETIVEPDGTSSYTIRKAGRRVADGTSITHLRRILRDVTTLVESTNPGWRSLFQRAHTHSR